MLFNDPDPDIPGDDPGASEDLSALRAFGEETLIRTARGAVRAAEITDRDLVESRTGEMVPVAWVERVTLGAAFLRRNPELRPVLICQSDLGQAPHRNVVMSPKQMIWTGESYAEARHLTRHPELFARTRLPVSYVAFQCEKPTVVNADGLWVSVIP